MNLKNQFSIGFVTLTVISFMVTGFFVYREVELRTKEDYTEALHKEITQISLGIENYMELILQNTHMLAENQLMKDLGNKITSYVDLKDDSGYVEMNPLAGTDKEKELYLIFQNFVQTHKEIDTVSLGVESNGGFVQFPASKRFNGYDARERDWYKLAKKKAAAPVLSDVYHSSNGSNNIISMCAVKDKNGLVQGVLTMNINLESLMETISQVQVGEQGHIAVVDSKGTLIVNTFDPDSVSENIASLGIKGLENYQNNHDTFVLSMQNGEEYSVTVHTPDVKKSNLNWTYITFVKESEYQKTANKLLQIAIAFSIFFAGCSGLIAILFTRNLLRPLPELTKQLQKIGEGNFSFTMSEQYLTYQDEIGDIARSADKMRASLKDMVEHIEYLAYFDHLTKLPNRIQFMEIMKKKLVEQVSGAVFMLDVDNFKEINDTMGHNTGDVLLIQIGERLNTLINNDIVVARPGGDEFLILLSGIWDLEMLRNFATKINDIMEEVFQVGKQEITIQFSIGITIFPIDANQIDQILMNADTAMYRAKYEGRNNFIFYNETMQTDLLMKKEVQEKLRTALKKEELYLLYQPQVSLLTGQIDSFEALVRLKNHKISPAVFIPIAEEGGLIVELGRMVAKKAIQQLANWKNKGLPPKRISINFSGSQLRDTGYINFLQTLLEEYEISPDLLEIEITEGILLEKNQETIEFLHNLKKLGFQIALDDFGTGYSSLNYLTYMPLNKVKFDKSMVDKFLNLENEQVIRSLISLAQSLNFKVTAEGVETWKNYLVLKENGCDFIQGYLFCKPVSPEDAELLYLENLIKRVKPEERSYYDN